jgi:CHAT domain-containing protein
VKSLIIIIFILISNCVYCQSIEQTAQNFWNAVNINDNEKVIKNGNKLINYITKNNFTVDSTVIQIYLRTALAYSNQGKIVECIKINNEALKKIDTTWDRGPHYIALTLNNLAFNYSLINEFESALEFNLKALELREKTVGKNHPDYAISLSNTASTYSTLGDYKKALELNKLALKIRDKMSGKMNLTYVRTLNDIATNHFDLGEYNIALDYRIKSIEILKKINGENNLEYAIILNNVALNYSKLGKYNIALQYNLKVLEIKERVLGKQKIELNLDYVISLNNIASNYSDLGNFEKALEFNLKAFDIIKKVAKENNVQYATILNNLALNYADLGYYQKALEVNFECLEIRQKILGDNHPDYALSLNNIGGIYFEIGKYENAIEYFNKALDVDEKTTGNNHPDFAISLNNLAGCHSKLCNYNKALEFNLKSLDIRRKIFGSDHPKYAISLNNIALNYSDLGNDEKALEYNLHSLNIREKTVGKNHPDYAGCLVNISSNFSSLGNENKALEYNLKALQIFKKTLGKKHPNYTVCLSNIAINYSILGDNQKALKFNLKSLDLKKEIFGEFHPDYALGLNNLAMAYYNQKKYSKALYYNLKAIDTKTIIYGSNHSECALSFYNNSFIHYHLGNFKKAFEASLMATEIKMNSYLNNRFGISMNEKLTSKKDLERYCRTLLNLIEFDANNISDFYKLWIGLNGVNDSDNNQIENLTKMNKDSISNMLYYEIKSTQIQLGKFSELSLNTRQNKSFLVDSLIRQISFLEMELGKRLKEFKSINRIYFYQDVLVNLKNDEVFIDFVPFLKFNYNSNQWSDSTQYLVFISDSKDSLVDYVLIEDGSKIDQDLFDQYKKEATNFDYKTELKDSIFYNSFWKPIADKIGDAKTIYFSLGGVYNNINLNTIYNPETGKYLLEEKDIRIVNSARDFVLSKESEKKNYTSNTASLFGFPNFDGNTTVSADTSDFFVSTRDLNSFWLDSLTRGGMKAKPLPATKTEVENISYTLKSKGWQVKNYLADNASEKNIKKQQSPRILHVATHGYFFQDIPMEKDNNRFLGMDRQQVVQDPMLRSGLLLTGSNKTLKGDATTGENGLLSAAEASLLDLRETELVVLSACETGKGEEKNSEGVYGLRKAFSDAGAQNIIMSLWKVDDKVTQEFMSRFYEIWLNEKTSIREAFNKTQLEIKAKYPQPYYWGAFILVGE